MFNNIQTLGSSITLDQKSHISTDIHLQEQLSKKHQSTLKRKDLPDTFRHLTTRSRSSSKERKQEEHDARWKFQTLSDWLPDQHLLLKKENRKNTMHKLKILHGSKFVCASVAVRQCMVTRRPRGGTCRLWSSERKIVLWCCTLVVNRHLTLTFLSPLSLSPRKSPPCSVSRVFPPREIENLLAGREGGGTRTGERFEERVEEDDRGWLGLLSRYIETKVVTSTRRQCPSTIFCLLFYAGRCGADDWTEGRRWRAN